METNIILSILAIIIGFGGTHLAKNLNTTRYFVVTFPILHPNTISILRGIYGFVFLLLFINGFQQAALFGLILAAISDHTDGVFAREFNLISNSGKYLDPLGDKLLYLIPFVYFSFIGIFDWIFVLIFIVFEFFAQSSRYFIKKLNLEVGANMYGKIKTTITLILLIVVVVKLIHPNEFYWIPNWENEVLVCCIMFSALSSIMKFVKK